MLLATVRNHSSMTVFNRDVRAKTTPWNPRLLQPTCVPELVRRSSRCRSTYCGFANAVFLINLGDDWTAHVNSKRKKKSSFISKLFKPLWSLWMCFVTSLHLQDKMRTPGPTRKSSHTQILPSFKLISCHFSHLCHVLFLHSNWGSSNTSFFAVLLWLWTSYSAWWYSIVLSLFCQVNWSSFKN